MARRSISNRDVIVEQVSTANGFNELSRPWNELLEASTANCYFLRWEWLMEWWKAYGGEDKALSILLVKRGEELIGIAPLYVQHRAGELLTKRRIMFLGTTEDTLVSEYMDLIYTPEDAQAVAGAVVDFIVEERLTDDVMLLKVLSSSATIEALRMCAGETGVMFRVLKDSASPYLALSGDFGSFLKSTGRSLRHNIMKGRRKLNALTGAEIRMTSSPGELEADFDELVRLHQARWRSRDLPGAFADERFLSFQRAITRNALASGNLQLLFLSIRGRNIAALYNIRYASKVYFYQSGIDATFSKKLSPGLILHSYGIELAIEAGLKEYDFMIQGDTDAYKDRWTDSQRHLYDIYMTPKPISKLITYARETIGSPGSF